MRASSLASSHLVFNRALESYGLDSKAIFERVGLDMSDLSDPDARYPDSKLLELWTLAIAEAADPAFGLRLARYWHPSALHALGFAWLASTSLHEALTRLVRYFRLITTGETLKLTELPDAYRLSIETPPDCERGQDEVYDAMLAILTNMCRASAGEDFCPQQILLRRGEPSETSEFEEFFRCPIDFEADCDAIIFGHDQINQPLPTANADMARASDTVINKYLADMDQNDVVTRVRVSLIDLLPSGEVNEQQVAQSLNMSLRTLQRKLQDLDTSYKELLDSTRRSLAIDYVRGDRMPIGEVSYLLGFAEPSNFTRAFKRWTGQSPSEYRSAE